MENIHYKGKINHFILLYQFHRKLILVTIFNIIQNLS